MGVKFGRGCVFGYFWNGVFGDYYVDYCYVFRCDCGYLFV